MTLYDFLMTTKNKLPLYTWFEQALLDLAGLGRTTMERNTRTEKYYYETVKIWPTNLKERQKNNNEKGL